MRPRKRYASYFKVEKWKGALQVTLKAAFHL